MNKAHTIKWLLLGPKTTISEISLWNVSHPEQSILTIYPARPGQPISRIASSFPWTVPATLTGGEYYILLKVGTLTAKSAPFRIVLPSHITMQKQNPPDWSKPHPDHPKPLNPNRPRITYFFTPANIYDKDIGTGRHFHVPVPRMPLSIYWLDPDGDLGRGRYRFTYSFSCNSQHEERDLGWKSFTAADNYFGNKGMGIYNFKVFGPCGPPRTFDYTFTLMDKTGHKSNIVRGTVHWVHQNEESTAAKDHKTGPPPSSTPEKESEATLFAPDQWVTGLPVYIDGTIPDESLKKNRSEKTLWGVSGKGCGKNLKETITVNYTSSTAFHLTWSVDPALDPGPYCLQALVKKPFPQPKS